MNLYRAIKISLQRKLCPLRIAREANKPQAQRRVYNSTERMRYREIEQ